MTEKQIFTAVSRQAELGEHREADRIEGKVGNVLADRPSIVLRVRERYFRGHGGHSNETQFSIVHCCILAACCC